MIRLGGIGSAFKERNFRVYTVGYLIYLITIGFLRLPPESERPQIRDGILTDILEGGRHIVNHAGIGPMLMLVFIGSAVSYSLFNLLPAFADIKFKQGIDGLSILMASAGLGAGMGALWLAYQGLSERTTYRTLASFLIVILAVCALPMGPIMSI